jgi:hypothetical protein
MIGSALWIIGLIVMLGSIGACVIPKVVGHMGAYDAVAKAQASKKGLSILKAIVGFSFGFLIMFSQGAVYYAEPGYNYLVQYPTGTQVGETSPGYHLKWWGTQEPFKKFITVAADDNPENNDSVSASILPIEGRFTDAVLAEVQVTARFSLPVLPEDFLTLAIAFRTQDNLENSTLIPVLKEVVRNAARTMTAQDYIAGKGGEFENSILDQLREGTYILEIEEIKKNNNRQNINEDGDRGIDVSAMVKYEVNKKTIDGIIVRKPTALHDYKILVAQSNVSAVDPEAKFKAMLGLQRDAAAQASVKKQEAKRAEYDKQKIIAEGETAKASIRIEQEKLQITSLIAAETLLKAAEIDLAQAKIQAKKEKEVATKIKIAADADAYKRSKAIAADGALAQKLHTLEVIAKYQADALAKRAVPTNYFASGASGGGSGGNYDDEMVRQLKLMNLNTVSALKINMKVK